MERYFSSSSPGFEFARNTLIVSLLGMAPLLVLYVFLTPGFAAHLATGGPALSRFMRQIITNGLPVVFAVNYIGFFVFAIIVERPNRPHLRQLMFAIDLPLRITVFVFIHAIIYVLSADWFGSFGGSKSTALGVVAPTLARSALFENISGVYLYAVLLASLPIYAAIFEKTFHRRSFIGRIPISLARWLLALIACSTFALILTGLATLIMWYQD
ncbi:hypothetical protein [Parasedimentitalea huanghaiensis]|uniref:Uncharacterized protein n=1 Tax=Parasedimentitalea huanghaiensis TaxID=2682100 RepID=A0A6L6WPV7_9RHOB|nr:hypothetical protein [Zongyanglinia huanghaiensis]MVO17612.1 hypothetical protein [Zongyanglinia huanghaiensis]